MISLYYATTETDMNIIGAKSSRNNLDVWIDASLAQTFIVSRKRQATSNCKFQICGIISG